MLSKTAFRCLNLGLKRPVVCQKFKFRCLNTNVDEKNLLQDHSSDLSSQIPEPPSIMDDQTFHETLKVTLDTLAHYGLDTYWPAGLIRQGLQQLHLTTGLPWWECIMAGVLVGRLLVLPFTLRNMRSQHQMSGHQKELTALTTKMNQARKAGDYMLMQLTQYEMMTYQKKHGMGVGAAGKIFVNNGPQAILFISFFMAIKRMASAPLESMKDGGCLWFVDLTTSDPTWLLSGMCSASLFFALKTGLDIPMDGMGQTMRNIFRYGLPTFVFFSTHYFPSAVLVYWTTSNCFSLALALILRNQTLRQKLKLPPRRINNKVKVAVGQIIGYDEDGNPIRKKRFIWTMKDKIVDGYKNFKARKNAAPMDQDLRHSDHVNFRKAGQGPLVPTYSYNPKEKFKEAYELREKQQQKRLGKFGKIFAKMFG